MKLQDTLAAALLTDEFAFCTRVDTHSHDSCTQFSVTIHLADGESPAFA